MAPVMQNVRDSCQKVKGEIRALFTSCFLFSCDVIFFVILLKGVLLFLF